MADNGFITPIPLNPSNPLARRQFLLGGSALALAILSTNTSVRAETQPPRCHSGLEPESMSQAPGWLQNGPRLGGRGDEEEGVETDPTLRAHARIMEIERAFDDITIDEDDPAYMALVTALAQADHKLAETRASTPAGIRAKLDRLAYHCAWEPEHSIRGHPLARSVIRDFAYRPATGS